MLTIRDKSTTPRPDKWRYPAVDGTEIVENSYMNLKREVAMHYRTNGRDLPSEQQIVDYLCANVSVQCYDDGKEIRNKYSDPPPKRGVRSPKWPFVLEPLKLLAKDGDKGLGDIVERVIGKVGGEEYKKWYAKIFGRPCSCNERRDSLNADYPL